MIKIKPFSQSPGMCGPASLKMVLSYYNISASESAIAKAAGASRGGGVSAMGLIRAAKKFGFKPYFKKNSTISDLEYFVKKGIPVIVDWFLEDDGHYSVVVDINKKNIMLLDPALGRKRTMPREKFLRVWFDFPGNFIKNSEDLILRAILVLQPLTKTL